MPTTRFYINNGLLHTTHAPHALGRESSILGWTVTQRRRECNKINMTWKHTFAGQHCINNQWDRVKWKSLSFSMSFGQTGSDSFSFGLQCVCVRACDLCYLNNVWLLFFFSVKKQNAVSKVKRFIIMDKSDCFLFGIFQLSFCWHFSPQHTSPTAYERKFGDIRSLAQLGYLVVISSQTHRTQQWLESDTNLDKAKSTILSIGKHLELFW